LTPTTAVLKFQPGKDFCGRYRTGVSLHSHTMHSREYLGRLPGYIAKIPLASYIIEREVGRLHLYTGRVFNFKEYYWTPPLSAREAHELESGQIGQLGLRALVSLSDHDNVEAGLHLRMLEGTADAPVSVEWSVPCEGTVFHIGVHNLPAEQAKQWMEEFEKFTKQPESKRLRELFGGLNAEPGVLLVLNHPFWDADGTRKPERHREALTSFLRRWGKSVHALELNGMRSRKENDEVVALGEAANLPVISGGDRHGCEPNATLNLSQAESFAEFVEEVRVERRSEILLMPQYFEPLRMRLLENAWHAMSDAPGEFGRRDWMTRVFAPDERGEVRALAEHTGARFQRLVGPLRWIMGLLASPQLRPALRMTFLGNEEGGAL
jgi:hypothetical protein